MLFRQLQSLRTPKNVQFALIEKGSYITYISVLEVTFGLRVYSARNKVHHPTKIKSELDLLKFEFTPILQIGFDAHPNSPQIKTSMQRELLIGALNPTCAHDMCAT